ncbi:MAG: C40 family peptidase [Desulfococcaceae bacterium]|jgi:lipoprotein Spr/probable lipoprotein NlpC|nr:C40 family peptidase [Desulfococcaceae bacterium]
MSQKKELNIITFISLFFWIQICACAQEKHIRIIENSDTTCLNADTLPYVLPDSQCGISEEKAPKDTDYFLTRQCKEWDIGQTCPSDCPDSRIWPICTENPAETERHKYAGNPQTEKSLHLADSGFYRRYSKKLGIPLEGTENKKLLKSVAKWMGTPYLWGGCSDRGIDCSCLIKNIYAEVYGMDLNRTSLQLCSEDFRPVDTKNLKEGDIICFDMEKNGISHVGMYLKNNKFVHASLSKGVRISNLQKNYYQKRLVMAGRAVSSGEMKMAKLSIGELLIVNR